MVFFARRPKNTLSASPTSTTATLLLALLLHCSCYTITHCLDIFGRTGAANKTNKYGGRNEMRAWTCHGTSQADLVHKLQLANIVKSDVVANVMRQTDRSPYVPLAAEAYRDTPVPIGHGATISAPHMHAHALEQILPYLATGTTEKRILDVGCGSGYLTACFGRWCANNSSTHKDNKNVVIGIDLSQDLVDLARRNMYQRDADLLQRGIVHLRAGNGWKGIANTAKLFDAIHVGAAATTIPQALTQQLRADGGIMIVPVGNQQHQTLLKVVRTGQDNFTTTELMGVRYVPLVDPSRKLSP